jgi:hypothetical protein
LTLAVPNPIYRLVSVSDFVLIEFAEPVQIAEQADDQADARYHYETEKEIDHAEDDREGQCVFIQLSFLQAGRRPAGMPRQAEQARWPGAASLARARRHVSSQGH